MRYLAFIFSLYFTFLALLPCQDREDMMVNADHVSIQKSHAVNDEHGQETCPPFCTCTCCSTARQLTLPVSISIFSESVCHSYPDFAIPAIQKQPVKIWQPPQIA
jgi:hypothetical protein